MTRKGSTSETHTSISKPLLQINDDLYDRSPIHDPFVDLIDVQWHEFPVDSLVSRFAGWLVDQLVYQLGDLHDDWLVGLFVDWRACPPSDLLDEHLLELTKAFPVLYMAASPEPWILSSPDEPMKVQRWISRDDEPGPELSSSE